MFKFIKKSSVSTGINIDSQRNKSQILLIKKVSSLLLKVTSLDEVLESAIQLICVHIGWPIGHAYYVEGIKSADLCPELIPTRFWYTQHPKKYTKFKIESDRIKLTDCAGICGRVLTSQQPSWTSIPIEDDPRNLLIEEVGLGFSCAIPIVVLGKVIAVLEFFDIGEDNFTEDIYATLSHIGEMLGFLIENQWSAQSIKESEQKFFSIFETSSDAIIITSDEGHILGANPAAIELFQYSKEELLGRNYFELFYPSYRGIWDAALEENNKEREVGLYQTQALSCNGSKFPVSLTISRWERGLSVFYYSIIRNLTETEKNLSLLQATLQATQDGILAIDSEGKIVTYNTSFLSIWETNPENIRIGTTVKELKVVLSTKVKDIEYFNSNLFRLENLNEFHQETIELKSGKLIEKQSTPRTENGIIVGRVYSFHDVTHRTLYINALSESEKLYRRTFEEANIGIAHVSLGGTFLRVNSQLAEMLEYSIEELQNKSFQEITYPADLKEDLDLLDDLLKGKVEEYCIKKRYFTKSGEIIWIELRVSLLRDSKELPLYFISIIKKLEN